MHTVEAAFDDQEQANAAVRALLDVGFPSTDIEVSQRAGARTEDVPVEWQTYTVRWGLPGIGAGLVAGATLAVALPAWLGVSELPAMWSRVFSDNPWLAALQGAFLGAIALGAVAGGIGVGTWRTRAKVDAGAERVWVGVHTQQGDLQRATAALREVGGRGLQSA